MHFQITPKQFVYLILSLITLVSGYAFLRYAYKVTDSLPFTQEIVLVILGTVATIFITALLLNKQTAVEVEKEQNIRFLELKTQTYQKLFDLLENMSLVDSFSNKELIHLQFITHRLAIISSPEVLSEYQNFLKVVREISQDKSFTDDADTLHKALSSLTLKIREDLIGVTFDDDYTQEQINKMIQRNSCQSVV
ncbi:MAG: hypothetical protein L3J01_01500 [Thiomicrorhabdus sp.]|nr:hypothetical protein [Thiomicrorhabdus sp.]